MNMAEEKEVGEVTHYFSKIGVAVIKIAKGELKNSDTIHIKGANTDFTQVVGSMQVDHKPVESAKKGESIGLKVEEQVREKDRVFKVIG